jgi:F-type H+-transporting ATPase subunit b
LKHLQNRLFASLISVVLLASFAGSLAPARAQEANPVAPVKSNANSSGQAALPAQPGQVKKEEAEEENLFRHAPLVQSISDAIFHDNPNETDPSRQELRANHVEKTARIFEWINFAIIMLAIVLPLAKILPRIMRRRSQTLKHHLEEARKTTADANTRLSAVEAQLVRLDEEIAQIRAHVEDESKQDEARIKASIEEESARIVASAEQEIAAAAAHAQRGLRHFAADLAIESAAKQLILTPETDRALISQFISDTTNGAAKGGHK